MSIFLYYEYTVLQWFTLCAIPSIYPPCPFHSLEVTLYFCSYQLKRYDTAIINYLLK